MVVPGVEVRPTQQLGEIYKSRRRLVQMLQMKHERYVPGAWMSSELGNIYQRMILEKLGKKGLKKDTEKKQY